MPRDATLTESRGSDPGVGSGGGLPSQKSKLRTSAIVPQHKDAHFILSDAKEEVVAKHMKSSSANVIPEESEPCWIGRNSVLGCLYFRKKPITQFRAALTIEVFERQSDVGLNRSVKM